MPVPIKYLAHYANRVAISNSRLVSIEGQQVVFRYRDHRHGGTWCTTSLPGVTFLERFLWHLVPKGLRRIRRFGWWGNRVRTEKLALLRSLLQVPSPAPADDDDEAPATQWDGDADEEPDPELRRLDEEQGTPRRCRACGGRRAAQAAVSHPPTARGRPDADAAQYGAIGGDRAGATAPALLRLLVTCQDDRSGTGCTGRFSSDVTTPCARGALGSSWKQRHMTHCCHTTRCASHQSAPLGHAARPRQRVRSSPQH